LLCGSNVGVKALSYLRELTKELRFQTRVNPLPRNNLNSTNIQKSCKDFQDFTKQWKQLGNMK